MKQSFAFQSWSWFGVARGHHSCGKFVVVIFSVKKIEIQPGGERWWQAAAHAHRGTTKQPARHAQTSGGEARG